MINSPVKVWRKQKEVTGLLGKQGRILAYSVIHIPPMGFSNQAPYPIVVIELTDGSKRTGQLVEWEKKHLKKGQKVAGVLRRIREVDSEEVIPYGVKWKPIT